MRSMHLSPIASVLVALLLIAQSTHAAPQPQARPFGLLAITVAVVDSSLNIRPVPLFALRVISANGDTTSLRTSVTGESSAQLPPGRYQIESPALARLGRQTFQWALGVELKAGVTTTVTLSNDNATMSASQDASPTKDFDTEAIFGRAKQSVFRVEAGLAHGTGFLIDSLGGVILTNAHVVSGADPANIAVHIDATHRYPAQVLARDEDADVAVLRVHPDLVRSLPRLKLQQPAGEMPAVPGEPLLALGFPLNQELTLTSGIASSVRDGAIISDVNINHGNSGGPLLNRHGEVLAINTFGDVAKSGPGVSGSILVGRAARALEAAADSIPLRLAPDRDRLPSMPPERLSLSVLKAYADTVDLDQYDGFTDLQVGGFNVTLQTPSQMFVMLKLKENAVAKDRKSRERKAEISESERYSEVREYRDWSEYVGVSTTPVVAIVVEPRIGETGGSLFARMMISSYLQATYKYQGDVRGVQVFRNGFPVTPIKGGHTPVRVWAENQWIALKDVADMGYYVFDAELLRPDSTGRAPAISVVIRDLKNPKKPRCRQIPGPVVARAWNDFKEFYLNARPDRSFILADPRRSRDGYTHTPIEDAADKSCVWY